MLPNMLRYELFERFSIKTMRHVHAVRTVTQKG